MAVNSENVFLVSGQRLESVNNGPRQLAPEIEQIVVVALHERNAYGALSLMEPNFRPVGHATLKDYDLAAARLRATIGGADHGWKLVVASGMDS